MNEMASQMKVGLLKPPMTAAMMAKKYSQLDEIRKTHKPPSTIK